MPVLALGPLAGRTLCGRAIPIMLAGVADGREVRAAAHKTARPAECKTWTPPTPAVDANGVNWLGRAYLAHAHLNAAAVVRGTAECHRLPGSWNYTVGMWADEINARTNGTWCVIPANPWPTEREALLTDAERAAQAAAERQAAVAAAAEQARLERDFRWNEAKREWIPKCDADRIRFLMGSDWIAFEHVPAHRPSGS